MTDPRVRKLTSPHLPSQTTGVEGHSWTSHLWYKKEEDETRPVYRDRATRLSYEVYIFVTVLFT